MFAYLASRVNGDPAQSIAPVVEVGPWPGLERVKKLIDNKSHMDLGLIYLSRIARCSPYYLLRRFRAVYKETPHRYQVRKRIEKAKALLAESSRTVTEICFLVGFESLGTFSARFREIVGWAPSVYRARTLAHRSKPATFIPDCYVYRYRLPLERSNAPVFSDESPAP